MRTILIKQATDRQAIVSRVLAGKTTAAQTASALKQLQDLNPNLDLNNLKPGSVILIPDAPSFNTAESDPVGSGTFDEFQQLVRAGLSDAAERLRTGDAARATDRADVTAALKSAALKRALDGDPDLKQQVADAIKGFKDEQAQEDQDEKAVAVAVKAALATLTDLGALLG